MPIYLTNRVSFASNAPSILSFLRFKADGIQSPPQFSLNSIKQMPKPLQLPLTSFLKTLSILNLKLPEFDERMFRIIKEKICLDIDPAESTFQIENELKRLDTSLTGSDLQLLYQATQNHKAFGYFTAYDWRMKFWGTVADIHTVKKATFTPETNHIDFTTAYTPPLPALMALADAFPSVRFHLQYRYHANEDWTQTDIFPITPFGY